MPRISFVKRLLAILKQELREFFGLDLPRRDIELNFVLKQTNKRGKRPDTRKSKIMEEFAVIESSDSSAILLMVYKEMDRINRNEILNIRRLKATKMYLYKSYPVLIKVLNNYQDNGRVPDEGNRADELDKCLRVVEELLNSFLKCFVYYYNLPNYRYAFIGRSINVCAMRIFELIQLQQMYCDLRYRDLPAMSWYYLNKVYHVMEVYESVEREIPLIKSRIDSNNKSLQGASLQRLFVTMQVLGYFDSLTLPTRYFKTLRGFISDQLPGLEIEKITRESAIEKDHLFTYGGNKASPAMVSKVAAKDLPGWTISLRRMKVNVLKNYLAIIDAVEKRDLSLMKSSFFGRLPEKDRAPFLMLLHYSIQHSKQFPYQAPTTLDLVAYAGFRDCHTLRLQKGGRKITPRNSGNFEEVRKKFIGEDSEEKARESYLWYMLYEDKKHIVLQVEEGRLTPMMTIGRVFIYDFQNLPDRRMELGIVSRMERKPGNQVIVQVRKLANYSESIDITEIKEEARDGKAYKFPAMLLLIAGSWHVLVVNEINYFNGKQVIIDRLKMPHTCTLGKLVAATEEFNIYQLQGEALQGFRPLEIPALENQ